MMNMPTIDDSKGALMPLSPQGSTIIKVPPQVSGIGPYFIQSQYVAVNSVSGQKMKCQGELIDIIDISDGMAAIRDPLALPYGYEPYSSGLIFKVLNPIYDLQIIGKEILGDQVYPYIYGLTIDSCAFKDWKTFAAAIRSCRNYQVINSTFERLETADMETTGQGYAIQPGYGSVNGIVRDCVGFNCRYLLSACGVKGLVGTRLNGGRCNVIADLHGGINEDVWFSALSGGDQFDTILKHPYWDGESLNVFLDGEMAYSHAGIKMPGAK